MSDEAGGGGGRNPGSGGSRPRPVRAKTWGADPKRHPAPPAEMRVFEPEEESNVVRLGLAPSKPRPRTREECAGGPRPCPFVGCEFNAYLDVSKKGGLLLNFPDLLPEEMDPLRSCVLDVVDREGEITLEEAGAVMNLTRERVRQVEEKVLRRLGRVAREIGLSSDDVDGFVPDARREPSGLAPYDDEDSPSAAPAPRRKLRQLAIVDSEVSDEEYAAALYAVYAREVGEKDAARRALLALLAARARHLPGA